MKWKKGKPNTAGNVLLRYDDSISHAYFSTKRDDFIDSQTGHSYRTPLAYIVVDELMKLPII